VELGDVPRPMRHNRHGFALWGGPHFRLVKPQRDGAPLDLRLFLRPAFRRWRRAAAAAEASRVFSVFSLFCEVFSAKFLDTCPS
jgi:hypothetical protein